MQEKLVTLRRIRLDRTYEELKPATSRSSARTACCLDRTYEELKLRTVSSGTQNRMMGLDRTYEELKPGAVIQTSPSPPNSLDRTYEELKLIVVFILNFESP